MSYESDKIGRIKLISVFYFTICLILDKDVISIIPTRNITTSYSYYCIHQTDCTQGFYPVIMGTTQVGIVSPMMFNLVVDNVIRTWLAMTVKYQRLEHDSLGDIVGQCLGFSYAEDEMVG